MRIHLLAALALTSLLSAPVRAETIPPDTGITAPAFPAVNALPTISGTAVDAGGSHVASVKVRLQELTTFSYFNSATGLFDMFLAPPSAWFDADPVDGAFDSDSEVWSATAAAIAINGIQGNYRLEAYAVDGDGNQDASPAALDFAVDVTSPVSSVALPGHATHRLTMTGIVGGAADFITVVTTVQVRVQNMTTGFYWDGANTFAATEYWSTATLAGPFFSQAFSAPLTYGTTYQVVSKAFDLAGNVQTDFSVGFASVSFLLDNSPPSTAAVTGVTAASAEAGWALVYGSTGYNLAASLTAANPPTVFASSQTSAETETSATISGLSVNTTYFFFVRAQGPAAATAYLLFGASVTAANPPVALASAGVTNASADLTWGANSNPVGTTFSAEAALDSGFGAIAASSVTLNAAATVSGLSPNTTYFLRVKAVNYGGLSTAYAAFVTSATDANAPVSPGAQADSSSQVTMTWGANSNPSGSLYVAQISSFSNFSLLQASSRTFSTTAVFTGLSNGTTYYLRVKTAGHNGSDTAFTASTSAVTGVAAPDAIGGSVKTSGGAAINLVQMDVYDGSGARVGSSSFTDGAGAWNFTGLNPAATYRVAATWTLNGVSSQIFQDGHHGGESGVPFTVELNVTLGSFFGTLHLAGTGPAAVRAATRTAVAGSYVDIYQNGVKVGSVPTDAQGRFIVSNLLPGSYELRPFDGNSYGVMTHVNVAAGQQVEVSFASTAEFLPMDLVYFYPNPARDHAVIRFESASPSLTAEASIFDLTGGLVRVLADGEATRSAGETSWNWNLTNSHGAGVASGVYFVRVKVVDASGRRAAVTKKLAVVR